MHGPATRMPELTGRIAKLQTPFLSASPMCSQQPRKLEVRTATEMQSKHRGRSGKAAPLMGLSRAHGEHAADHRVARRSRSCSYPARARASVKLPRCQHGLAGFPNNASGDGIGMRSAQGHMHPRNERIAWWTGQATPRHTHKLLALPYISMEGSARGAGGTAFALPRSLTDFVVVVGCLPLCFGGVVKDPVTFWNTSPDLR